MSKPDLKLTSLTYDSENEVAHFIFNGWRSDRPASANGQLHVASPGDLPESQVRAAVKAELKRMLSEMSDAL